MPQTVAIIQARMTSTRLPGKVLQQINQRPMLSYMVERVKRAKLIDDVVIATSTGISDNSIEEFCHTHNCLCFRGNLDDVLDRYFQAAVQVGCKTVVRLTSDCPVIDPEIIDSVVLTFNSGGYDYCANTAPPEGSTFPDGMDVEVFSFAALEKAWKEATKPSDREHVTFYFWHNPDKFKTYRYDLPENLSSYRLTVDYPADFEVIKSILSSLYPVNPKFTMQEVIDFLNQNKEVLLINSTIVRNQGWLSAFEKDKKAGF